MKRTKIEWFVFSGFPLKGERTEPLNSHRYLSGTNGPNHSVVLRNLEGALAGGLSLRPPCQPEPRREGESGKREPVSRQDGPAVRIEVYDGRGMMDLKNHLLRQMAWSHATFGPGARKEGVVDHIRKEIAEVLAEDDVDLSATEWVDVVILALDGLTRQLVFQNHEQRGNPSAAAVLACVMIEQKQAINEGRVWPDWRTAEEGKAIEHDRSVSQESPDAP